MAKVRSYKLLCPIARALDRIGDRWTLLILRDLHAGPARFTDLQKGLTGIAANLLTERLGKLVADGLVEKGTAAHGAAVYALTPLGAQTQALMFDLAVFGARFPPEGKVVAPGNLRTVATTLGAAAARIEVPEGDLRVAFRLGGEEMALTLAGGIACVEYGAAVDPEVTVETGYEDLLALTEGEIDLATFAGARARIEADRPEAVEVLKLFMARVLAVFEEA